MVPGPDSQNYANLDRVVNFGEGSIAITCPNFLMVYLGLAHLLGQVSLICSLSYYLPKILVIRTGNCCGSQSTNSSCPQLLA